MSLRYNEWESVYQDLRLALARAQDERPNRQQFTQDGELEWVAYERNVMVDRVNLLRSRRALPPVDSATVRRKESLAEGHIDYSQKFAIGCADLVFQEQSCL